MSKPRRKLTFDDGVVRGVYTEKSLGPTRSLTPEGFMLCRDVHIARTGEMIYGPGEVPVEPGPDGLIRITRDKAALLAPDAVASYNGKPVVLDHPPDHVRVKTWRNLSQGVILNPRPGEHPDEPGVDTIVADLLLYTQEAIAALGTRREVSGGYDADYEDNGDGTGRQTNILGNHVALVEKGRCGPRCAIGDSDTTKEPKMATTKVNTKPRTKVSFAARVRQAFRDAEAAALEDLSQVPGAEGMADDEPAGDEGGHTHVHVHMHGGAADPTTPSVPSVDANTDPGSNGTGVEARVAALEKGVQKLEGLVGQVLQALGGGGGATPPAAAKAAPAPAPAAAKAAPAPAPVQDASTQVDDPEDPEGKRAATGDSVALQTSFAECLSLAEILVPGLRLPTFDAKAARKLTVDAMCQLRKRALETAYNTADGRALIDGVAGASNLDIGKMTCDSAAGLFRQAATVKRMVNNTKTAKTGDNQAPPPAPAPKRQSVAQLAAAFAAYYGTAAR